MACCSSDWREIVRRSGKHPAGVHASGLCAVLWTTNSPIKLFKHHLAVSKLRRWNAMIKNRTWVTRKDI